MPDSLCINLLAVRTKYEGAEWTAPCARRSFASRKQSIEITKKQKKGGKKKRKRNDGQPKGRYLTSQQRARAFPETDNCWYLYRGQRRLEQTWKRQTEGEEREQDLTYSREKFYVNTGVTHQMDLTNSGKHARYTHKHARTSTCCFWSVPCTKWDKLRIKVPVINKLGITGTNTHQMAFMYAKINKWGTFQPQGEDGFDRGGKMLLDIFHIHLLFYFASV